MGETNKYLKLEKELTPYKPILAKASDAILDGEVSSYPIFILHKQELDMGLPMLEGANKAGDWKVHASTLEEFVTKQLIDMSKVDDFIKVFKDPEAYYCLFVISELGAQFIFIPR